MTTQEQYIERLKELTTAEFGRQILTHDDCIALSNAVMESVGIDIDIESLEQLFLTETNNIAPRPLMLSSLARYVGFTGWSDFCTARDVTPTEDRDRLPVARHWGVIGLTAVAILVVIISIIALVRGGGDDDNGYRSVDSRFRNVEQEWLAGTTEHCNTLRAYYDTNDAERYNERVDSFIERYDSLLRKRVKSSIEEYAIANKITIDNDTIDQTADIIIDKCLKMCETIKIK